MLRLCLALAVAVQGVSGAEAETWRRGGFRFAEGGAVRIIVFEPEVLVGSIDMGGVEVIDPDWTAAARAKLASQIEARQRALGNEIVFLPHLTGEEEKLVADYKALFRVVASAAEAHEIQPGKALPAKPQGATWTLGPGAARIGAIGGGGYALFVISYDAFGTGPRKFLRVLTGEAAAAMLKGSGIHRSYAALVELSSGDLVWFNSDPQAGGDPRTDEGAAKRVRQLFGDFPKRRTP